ncbi:MAG: hypothetical protein M1363_06065, partial [Gammaproteobacteria bacterium]|nr:hypothetical protein [Gammaproteobacteria bacterium]
MVAIMIIALIGAASAVVLT